ncbi:MAG: hypothetical protein WKF42_08580 [Solirubrobacteraceae bacterium]
MSAVRWACVVAALGAAAYLLLEPASADLPAQQYRAGIVHEAGVGLWNNGWFAGHHTPGYSLLSPPRRAARAAARGRAGSARCGRAVRNDRAAPLG